MEPDFVTIRENAAELKASAKKLAKAASYMSLAAKELGSVAVPVASKALTKRVNKAGIAATRALSTRPKLAGAMSKVAVATESQVKRAVVAGAIVGALAFAACACASALSARGRKAQLEADEEKSD